jgi:hypothetical protein
LTRQPLTASVAHDALLSPGTEPLTVEPIEGVKTGLISPWFDEVGLGTQHELPKSVQWLLDNGYLREVP